MRHVIFTSLLMVATIFMWCPVSSLASDNGNLSSQLDVFAASSLDMSSLDDLDDTVLGQRKKRGRGSSGGGVWVNAYIGDTVIKRDTLRVEPDMLGLQVGYDRRLFGARMSLYYNYGNTFTATKLDGLERTRWKVDQHLIGLSLSKYWTMSHIIVLGSAGYDAHKISKWDGVGGTAGKANGVQGNIYVEWGLDIVLPNRSWSLKPFTAIKYNYLFCGNIDSKDDGTISVPNNSNHALTWMSGVRCNKRINTSLELQGRVAWLHQFLEENRPIESFQFSMVSGTMTPTQFLVVSDAGRDKVWLGVGLKWYVGYSDIRAFIDYDFTFNDISATHFGSLGVLFAW